MNGLYPHKCDGDGGGFPLDRLLFHEWTPLTGRTGVPEMSVAAGRVVTMPDGIFAGLNDEQAQAVACVSGPVVILAGAGSGKTTTVTRRIAHQVAGGTPRSERILAVPFTAKPPPGMGSRLPPPRLPPPPPKTFPPQHP